MSAEIDKNRMPELRFREFDGEWVKQKLGDVLTITSAARVHKNEWTAEGIPFFRSSDVIAEFKGTMNTKAYIPTELYETLSNKIGRVKKGDLLVTGGGSIGIPFLIKNNDPIYFKDADLLWLKNTGEISGYFLYSYLITQSFRKYLKSISHIGTIAHYTVIQAKNTPLKFPSLPEQQKIANFLSAVDQKIQQLQRKKELLTKYKKGMMQKLFIQEIRFKDEQGNDFPEWEEKKLGELCIVNPKVLNLPQNFNYIDLESVSKGQLTQKKRIDLEEAPSRAQRYLSRNDILYQTVRPYQMNNYFFDLKGEYVASTGYAQLRAVENPIFLYQKIHDQNFVNKVLVRCTGTSYPAINSKDLAKIKIEFPSLPEQQKIASFLSALDEKVAQVGQQIKQAQRFKKGLLQKMFV